VGVGLARDNVRVSLLAAERIKLFSTRTPWLCTVLAVLVSAGFGAAYLVVGGDEIQLTVASTQAASTFGRVVVLVMSVLAATTEFRRGTTVPALLAKAVVVAGWSAAVGLACGFGSWLLGWLLNSDTDLSLTTAADWRAVAGQGPLFALTALFGLGAGLLIRCTGLAVTAVLIWSQVVENLIFLIPGIGRVVYRWLPFFAADRFSGADFSANTLRLRQLPLGPVGYGAYFGMVCLLIFIAGVLSNRKSRSFD